jgi:ATP-dependent protease ClpP protease subunit
MGHVHVHACGICASAAAIVLLAGDSRTAESGTRIIFHHAEIVREPGERLTSAFMAEAAAALAYYDRRVVEIISARTQLSAGTVAHNLKSDWELTATQAYAHGILTSRSAAR